MFKLSGIFQTFLKERPTNEFPNQKSDAAEDEQERWEVLAQLEDWLKRPMLAPSFIWLSLVFVELIWTTSSVFELLGTIIWIIFIIEFRLRFTLAPQDQVPATQSDHDYRSSRTRLPVLRALRLLRLTRGLRLVKIVSTANRGLEHYRKASTNVGLAMCWR